MSTTLRDYDYLFKILVVGDSLVGKTALIQRYTGGSFNDDLVPSIGVSFSIRKIEIGGSAVKLQLWDTAGLERFDAITSSYYRGAVGIIIMYDVTSARSFAAATGRFLRNVAHSAHEDTLKFIVGNKSDMEERRQVATEDALKVADAHGIPLIEVSAKDKTNVDHAFESIALRIKEHVVRHQAEPTKCTSTLKTESQPYKNLQRVWCLAIQSLRWRQGKSKPCA